MENDKIVSQLNADKENLSNQFKKDLNEHKT